MLNQGLTVLYLELGHLTHLGFQVNYRNPSLMVDCHGALDSHSVYSHALHSVVFVHLKDSFLNHNYMNFTHMAVNIMTLISG